MIVERATVNERTSYMVRDDDGNYFGSLTFRDVMALVAAEGGRVRAKWQCTYSPWFYDAHLVAACDDYGVGHGTLGGLQSRRGRPPLIERCGEREGTLGLTLEGAAVLAGIRALVGPGKDRAA